MNSVGEVKKPVSYSVGEVTDLFMNSVGKVWVVMNSVWEVTPTINWQDLHQLDLVEKCYEPLGLRALDTSGLDTSCGLSMDGSNLKCYFYPQWWG